MIRRLTPSQHIPGRAAITAQMDAPAAAALPRSPGAAPQFAYGLRPPTPLARRLLSDADAAARTAHAVPA
jgi:hypothetical protein